MRMIRDNGTRYDVRNGLAGSIKDLFIRILRDLLKYCSDKFNE